MEHISRTSHARTGDCRGMPCLGLLQGLIFRMLLVIFMVSPCIHEMDPPVFVGFLRKQFT